MLSKKQILESHACIRIVFFEMVNKKKVKEKITVDHLFEDNINTNSYRPSLDIKFHLEEGL